MSPVYQSTIPLQVRFAGGTYVTGRIMGMSASSTSGASEAVRRLAGKLSVHGFGPSDHAVRQVEQATGQGAITGCGIWVIEEASTSSPAPAQTPTVRDCRTCMHRTWSGSGSYYDCNAAHGMPLPTEHHDGHVPAWCTRAADQAAPKQGA